MYNRSKILAFAVLICLPLSLLATIPIYNNEEVSKEPAKFVLAGWSYPDEYGQGIYMFRFYENSTGSWVAAPWYYVGGELDGLTFYSLHSYDPYALNWSSGVSMKIRVYTTLNQTLVGVASTAEGQNYLRHNVNVASGSNSSIFSQQNFTYYDATDTTGYNYAYVYDVILDFIPAEFSTYVITVNYEVYFETFGWGESYLHDCSDTSDITYSSNSGLDPEDYGIGSNGSIVEMWITPDSVSDEYVIYKLDFTNIDNSDGDINLTVRYRVEDGFIGFRLTLYYDDATSDSTGLQTSQTWSNLTIDADSGKVLDYVLLYCDDNPSSVTSGNRSVYIDFIEITNPTDTLEYFELRWNLVSIVIIYFSVSANYWALNMSLIFGGLILMLVSVCILAKKVRDRNITNDAGILLLFLFCVGWGLFIGGTIIG